MPSRFILLLSACLLSLFSWGQSIADIQSPKLIPPSPDAAALGKYGQIPVDKSTGIPDISIPLYQIKTPRFTLPISLSYHASGIKLDEIASWVGLGWSLGGQAVITRGIAGVPDDNGNGFLYTTVPSASSLQFPRDSTYIANSIQSGTDTQPDNFFYNFSGQTGAFVFGVDKKPVLTPYKALKISFDTVSGFRIIDEQGNRYQFNSTERVETTINNTLQSPISSWYLTQMISADLSDTILFTYKQDSLVENDFSYSFTQNIGPQFNAEFLTLPSTDFLYPLVCTITERSYFPLRLSKIQFNGGKVDFIGKNGRLDNAAISLDSVIVSNYNSSTGLYSRLKSFKLQTSYLYSNIGNTSPYLGTDDASRHRLILTGLVENDLNNTPQRTTQFSYNPINLPPVHNFGQDMWGFYNGQYSNPSLLPTQNIIGPVSGQVYTLGGGYQTDRSVLPDSSQAGMLQKITYPTKGYTLFTYENNQVSGVTQGLGNVDASAEGYYEPFDTVDYTPTANNLASGGSIFHIKIRMLNGLAYPYPVIPFVEIIDVLSGNIIFSKSANTYTNVDSLCNLPIVAGRHYQVIANAQATGANASSNTTTLPYAAITTSFQSNNVTTISAGGLRIASVKSYDSDSTLLSTQTYRYGDGESGAGVLLSASLITNRISHNTFFQMAPDPATLLSAINAGVLTTYCNNSVYQLSSLSGSPVGYNTVTVYNGDPVQNTGKSMYKYVIFSDSLLLCNSAYMGGLKPIPVTWKNGDPIWEGEYKKTGAGQYSLLRETVNTYNYVTKPNGRGLLMNYTYEAYNFPLTHYLDVTANGVYFFDYPISAGVRVPSQTVVNQYDPTGTVLLMTDTTSFYYDDTTLVLPTRTAKIDSKGHSNLIYTYRPLDKAAINALTPLSSTASVAIDSMVARNIISPIIQQVQYHNSVFTQLSLTNYQAWTSHLLAPQTVQTQLSTNPLDTRLQFNQYDTNGNALELQKTNDVKEVYLWGYHGQYPVAKILNSTYAIASTYVTQSVLDNPPDDATLRTQLNNLRGIPGALVTSYTYKPLVGVTSETDPQGKTIYYEYDAFSRLKDIKDLNGNIIRTQDYHYKQP